MEITVLQQCYLQKYVLEVRPWLSLCIRQNDNASLHYECTVLYLMNINFTTSWTRWGDLGSWPQSPNLNPTNFFLWDKSEGTQPVYLQLWYGLWFHVTACSGTASRWKVVW